SFLEYLPVVESSYTTRARSKSGALGMWQFMANSTKPFLIRNDFVDERYDPWRSTEAALSKLQENYNMFKDWALAIAAYNCGAGALSRAMKKNPGKDFWGLADANQLSEQTTNYVPKLLAIADVATNSEYYNVDIPSASDELGEPINPRAGFFDYAEAKGSVSLRRVAQEMRIDESLLFSLNAALIKGITPPNQKWKIRVPEGMAESAKDALSIITPYTFQTKYIVQKGDSLWGISRKYKISVASICEVNNISEKQVLQIGKILYIPFE
ncbi:MAG: transglycosylase SLT domain-containing protein, partial [Treponema sp.]|nr:transglycosylase SLT domain-containing protein [Treponema sp.]